MSRIHPFESRGFTLIELLVTLAVVGIILSLLIVAVQSARESVRRIKCANNVKQQAIGALLHESLQKQFPTGGWGFRWVGDPNRGTKKEQPGGWIFNVLPYIEQSPIHQLGFNLTIPGEQRGQLAIMIAKPLPLFHCPSRRIAQNYPSQWEAFNTNFVELVAKSDYAANAGNDFRDVGTGPISLEQGDSVNYQWPHMTADGICFLRSEVTVKQISDGTSQTILLGEKNLPRGDYLTGEDRGDDQSMYSGDDFDTLRWTNPALPPIHDSDGFMSEARFGTAHNVGLNVAFCDGSVRIISYSIERFAYANLGNRRDGNVSPP